MVGQTRDVPIDVAVEIGVDTLRGRLDLFPEADGLRHQALQRGPGWHREGGGPGHVQYPGDRGPGGASGALIGRRRGSGAGSDDVPAGARQAAIQPRITLSEAKGAGADACPLRGDTSQGPPACPTSARWSSGPAPPAPPSRTAAARDRRAATRSATYWYDADRLLPIAHPLRHPAALQRPEHLARHGQIDQPPVQQLRRLLVLLPGREQLAQGQPLEVAQRTQGVRAAPPAGGPRSPCRAA